MGMIRTLIVDDNAGFRQCARELLASAKDIEVIGEAASSHEAILRARELRPDLVLMDVSMPGGNGIDATRQLKNEMPELKVIMLSVFDIEQYREAALASGSSGYVVKKSMTEELLPMIRQAMSEQPSVPCLPGGHRTSVLLPEPATR